MKKAQAKPFFDYAKARHQIYLDRAEGLPAPWTEDEVLRKYSFTNVYRELDRTTIWFRHNVRNPLRDSPWVVPATVIFRWFNRITTGEQMLLSGLLSQVHFDLNEFEKRLRAKYPDGPWVTGAYMVFSGKKNGDKLTGLLIMIYQFLDWWYAEGEALFFGTGTKEAPQLKLAMQGAHETLSRVNGLAGFTAYEVVTDLRWTSVIRPRDKLSWCHVGPGSTRGMSRLLYGEPDRMRQESFVDQQDMLREMEQLLEMSASGEFLPQTSVDWPYWEMREVEHTLCEYDKYTRLRREQGSVKQRFREAEAGPLLIL